MVAWPLGSPCGVFGCSGTTPGPGRPGPLSADRVLIPWLFPPVSIWKCAHVHTCTFTYVRHTQTFDWEVEVVGIPRCLYHGSYGWVLQFGDRCQFCYGTGCCVAGLLAVIVVTLGCSGLCLHLHLVGIQFDLRTVGQDIGVAYSTEGFDPPWVWEGLWLASWGW